MTTNKMMLVAIIIALTNVAVVISVRDKPLP